ncbi:MAG: hypothetical protein EXR97_00530 [Nitrospiraceae bacterium]|nr:hypothetical protein [Nitrospiraceae bacterium]MSR23940.1 hypothetical protein [Nitrospiraceae bacterium]
MPDRRLLHTRLAAFALAAGLVCSIALAPASSAHAVGMANDPNGFNNIPWGTALDGRPELTLANSAPHIKEYDLKAGPLPVGEAKVDMMRLSTFDGKFARVTIRYRGKNVHDQVLAYLQAQYGSLDRTPGQTMRGTNQQYNWRGTDTEINMTYEGRGERGFLFIESAVLAPRFSDLLAEHGY